MLWLSAAECLTVLRMRMSVNVMAECMQSCMSVNVKCMQS